MIQYGHKNWLTGETIALPVGKAVCIGRNYSEHIKELGNKPSADPLLFIKHQNTFCDADKTITVPERLGVCHHELELAILIGAPLSHGATAVVDSIWGYGLALDLTLRDIQSKLKEAGQPWEKAKSFDGACPLTPFVPAAHFKSGEPFEFELIKNGATAQVGSSDDMLFSIQQLLEAILEYFTLMPGDMVLTGTPAGVSALNHDDQLQLVLQKKWQLDTQVRRP